MLSFYKPKIKKLSTEQYLHKCGYKLLSQLDFDIAKLIEFNNKKDYALITKKQLKNNISYEKNFFNSINLSKKSNCIINSVVDKKEIVVFSDIDTNDSFIPLIKNIKIEIYIPLFLDTNRSENIIGCIYLGSFDNNEMFNFKDCYTNEVANTIAKINNLYQIKYLNTKELLRLSSFIYLISEITKEKEPFMINHPYRVAQWSNSIGKELSLDEKSQEELYMASLIHDIGKLFISRDLLNKSSILSEEEYEIIKKHSIYSFNIVSDLRIFQEDFPDLPEIVKYHHERYDGKGYPNRLKGEEIPLLSRILCVSDAVDAMLSPRSYKNPSTLNQVVKELIKNKGKQFDPKIVDIMVSILTKSKKNTEELFSDSIVWSSLNIITSEDTHTIEGTLQKHKGVFIFRSELNFLKDIDTVEIQKMFLYIERNNTIYEYNVKLDGFNDNIVYISKLEFIPSEDSFNMLWNLNGQIFNNDYIYDINIYKLGGNSMSFYLNKIKLNKHLEDKIIKLKIFFENENELFITGKVTSSFSLSNKKYYTLEYINMPDNVKDSIFKQLFRKQMEIKKLSNHYL